MPTWWASWEKRKHWLTVNFPGLRLTHGIWSSVILELPQKQFKEGTDPEYRGGGATARDAEAGQSGVSKKGYNVGSIYQHNLLGLGVERDCGVLKIYMSLPCFVERRGHISLLLLGNKVKDDQSPTLLASEGRNGSWYNNTKGCLGWH